MKIYGLVFVSFSLMKGGAAIAAKKFKLLAKQELGISADILSQDNSAYYQFFKRLISFGLSKFQSDRNSVKHSLNLFSYQPVLKLFHEKPHRLIIFTG